MLDVPLTSTFGGALAPGTAIAGRFVVEQVTAEGGMAAVYRARDLHTDTLVAVKLMTTHTGDMAHRFRQEVAVLRELEHPGIVRYVADGTTETGCPFLTMEWLEGEDLAARLVREPLSLSQSVRLAVRVATALGAAHARGVVHRDVKPSNLFLPGCDIEQVKLLDFGVARGHGERITTKGGVVGTIGYMAPEQARGAVDIDARADVFSLGCVLFECLTGRPAFAGEQVMAILAKILLEDAPRLRDSRHDVPAALDALVTRTLAKDRRARPASGSVLAAELLALGGLASDGPGSEGPGASLTHDEQRLLCVVMAGRPPTAEAPSTTADAARQGLVPPARRAPVTMEASLAAMVRAFLGHAEQLVDGSVVVTIGGQGAATDQAARAAACALGLRAMLPDAPMALATGRGEVSGRLPVGEVIDRAAKLVRQARDAPPSAGVRIDEVTVGLLDARFELEVWGTCFTLLGEREPVDSARTLLGKPTPCVGRDRELALLAGALDECVADGSPRVVLVTAAAGVGKSRLRHELLRDLAARRRPIEVWSGRGDPTSAGAPFAMLAPIVRRAAGVLDGEPVALRVEKVRARVARHVRAEDARQVAEFLGEVIGAPFPDDRSPHLRAARADAIVMGDQTRRAFSTFLLAETEAHPVLIVLEDLHWGDVPSVALLDSALSTARDRPWMILALARPEVRTIFPDLWAGRGLTHTELRELSPRACERLVRAVLREPLEQATVDRLVLQAAGNAFYLEELIRAVAEGKGDALPPTVLAMVQARLEALEPEVRRALRAASVFGQVFWGGAVAKLLGLTPGSGSTASTPEVPPELGELTARELIAELPTTTFPGEREYGFRHAVVREAAYTTLTDHDRALGHELAGEWLEAAGEPDAVVVAAHFERGGNAARAVEWLWQAGQEALAANDFDAAIASATRGIECGAAGATLGALHMVRCEAHAWKSEHARSLEDALSATRAFGRKTDPWFSAIGRVALECRRLGRGLDACRWAQALLESWPEGDGSAASIVAACHAADTVLMMGNRGVGEELMYRIEARLAGGAALDPAILGHVYRARATRSQLVARDPSAHAMWLQCSVAAFDEAGDLRNACIGRANRGFGLLVLGSYEESENELRAAMQTASRLGLHTLVAVCEHNLGGALCRSGRVDEGVRVERAAIASFGHHGDVRLEAASRAYLAELLLEGGDVEGARAEAERAVALAEAIAPTRAQALAILARIHLARNEAKLALEAAREAQAHLDRLGALESWTELVRLVFAETLDASGDRAGARAAIESARVHLLDRAALIASPAVRAVFLGRVRECARTLRLADEWSRPSPTA